ncbi:MAG TPA: M20/M25/M40 family metallo-hydrolase [Candidatus Acetothermia bacterium]|nr:M20/M25/M40 family metallo-hydrolase [Candidatus Acetothermia bacterium]
MDKTIVDQFCEFVKIDSESGEEERFIGYLQDLFTSELDARCTLDNYGNLIARIQAKGSTKSESLLLAAHADTVKPGKGIEPVVKDGVIRSGGETILGADDKAGIAEIFEAVRTAAKRPPVEIVITRGEEVGLLGAKNLDVSLVNAKMGFIVDGEDAATIVIGGPTHISLDIEIIGKAAHAGMEPEKGISAIRVASVAISRMPLGRIDDETTANIGTIHGGMIRNGIPDHVTIQGECRSLDDKKAMQQAEVMRKAFEEAAKEARAKVEVKIDVEYRASRTQEGAPVVKLAQEAIRAVGLTPQLEVITGGTDALVLTGRGIDAVVLGYGGTAAHTMHEQITIEALDASTAVIKQIIERAA